MNVVHPPSTEAAITSLLLVHIQTDLADDCRFPSRPLVDLSDVDRVINGLVVLFMHVCVTVTRAAVSMVKIRQGLYGQESKLQLSHINLDIPFATARVEHSWKFSTESMEVPASGFLKQICLCKYTPNPISNPVILPVSFIQKQGQCTLLNQRSYKLYGALFCNPGRR